MSGNQLIISNFRSWRNDNYFDLESINLLLGANSSGKSSIIHALSLLKQSNLSWNLIPKSGGIDGIDLGRIEDQVNYKTKSKDNRNHNDYIGFGLKYRIKPDDIRRNRFRSASFRQRSRPSPQETSRQSNDFASLIGNIEYIERYNDQGLIQDIKLSSRKRDILTIRIEKHELKRSLVSVEITDEPSFWEQFIDLSGKIEIQNKLSEVQEKEQIKNLEEYEKEKILLQKKNKKLISKIKELEKKSSNLSTKEDSERMEQNLSDIKSNLRFVEFQIRTSKKTLEKKEIPGTTVEEKCSYIAKNLSTKFYISLNNLQQEEGLVSHINSLLFQRSGLMRQHMYLSDQDTTDEDDFLLTGETLELLSANAKSHLDIHPYKLLSIVYGRFKQITTSVVRIGPHRERPDRVTFVNPNDKSTFVGTKGENVMSIINQISKSELKELNRWFGLLGIPYDIKKKFNKLFNVSQLILTDQDGMAVSLADVGYGIGQVLPIVLTSMTHKNTIITIEQPELHLHPKLQANLADLFILSASRGNNNFILETHSEHIILRLKRRQKEANAEIAQEKILVNKSKGITSKNRLKTDNSYLAEWRSIRDSVVISVIDTPKNKSESEFSQITLNSDGDFDNLWPGDFFPERFIEMGLEDDY